MRVGIALAAALLLIAIAAAATLAHKPLVLAMENAPFTHTELVRATGPVGACQTKEVLPAGTSAIRFGLTTVLGSKVSVKVFSGSRLVTQGEQAPGWEGASVTVPVKALAHRLTGAKVCLHLSLLSSPIAMLGWDTPRDQAAIGEHKPLPGRMHIEYLRPAEGSWWTMASSVAFNLGLGRAASGAGNALLLMALAAALIALSSWLLLRELR